MSQSPVPSRMSTAQLIERLRFLSNGFDEGSETERVMWQAADEIERLRRQLGRKGSK